jgi:hypothetical protein
VDYGSNLGFLSEVLSEQFGGLVSWWVGGSVGQRVGGLETKNPKQEIHWRVGGLVGSYVGGLVGRMPERNLYWAHTGFCSCQNRLLFLRWNGKE